MSARFGLGVLVGSVVALSVAVALRGGSGTTDAGAGAEQAALVAYTDALAAPTEAGGAVVVYGMRPGISDIADGAHADDVLVTMAEGWVAEMRRIRAQIAALDTPEFLEPVAAQMQAALAGYVRTAEKLLAAARATGAERDALLGEAARLGTEADTLFDTALEAISAQRARLGLPLDDNHTGGSP